MAKGDIDSIDPNRWWAAITWGLANGLCTTLLRYADQAGAAGVELVPGWRTCRRCSADGTEYTFTLKEAYFADGDPITPADIKHTFLRMSAPRHRDRQRRATCTSSAPIRTSNGEADGHPRHHDLR